MFTPSPLLPTATGSPPPALTTPYPPAAPPVALSTFGRVFFAPAGNHLASANEDGVRIWPLWSAAADSLCTRVWRNLSMEEWKFYIGEGLPYERTCPNRPPGAGAPGGPK